MLLRIIFPGVILIALFSALGLSSQTLQGTVKDKSNNPLYGAAIFWMNTSVGVISDENGNFEIEIPSTGEKNLICKFVGFLPDTIVFTGQKRVNFILENETRLEEVTIEAVKAGYFFANEAAKVEVISSKELTKAACCDLAGCFETQTTVMPMTTNVLTNSKELRILGISGVYNQVLVDNLPLIQGLSFTYGVSAIPGPLVDKIFVSKGANSVLQGFESMSGQINVLLLDPDNADKLLLNAYANQFGESQYNLQFATPVDKDQNWHTLVGFHLVQPGGRFDRDKDGFLDVPLVQRYSFFNKWIRGNDNERGWFTRFGLRMTSEERTGGQTDYKQEVHRGSLDVYGQNIRFRQPEVYTRTGFTFSPKHRLVFYGSAQYHKQDSWFGETRYDARQAMAYSNLQHEFVWREEHLLKTGISYRFFDLKEDLSFRENVLNRTFAGLYLKQEHIPGLWAEHAFNWKNKKYMLLTGFRADYHNRFGWQAVPRMLAKADLDNNTTVRASAGTGWRTVNLFSENVNLLSSSRDVHILEELRPEKAITWGVSVTRKQYWDQLEATLSLDYFQTRFLNQIFPDYDHHPDATDIFNFEGLSLSNGFQADLAFLIASRVESKFGYNYLNVFRDLYGVRKDLHFVPRHRFSGNISYRPLTGRWYFDAFMHWYGPQKLVFTGMNPVEYQVGEYSDAFYTFNIQITHRWKIYEFYAGAENLFDFRQLQPIVAWQDPYGPWFETSNIWGPTRGREVYAGIRIKLAKE